ncbi:Hypothetical predicted protein, partial [Drosophila guanche]
HGQAAAGPAAWRFLCRAASSMLNWVLLLLLLLLVSQLKKWPPILASSGLSLDQEEATGLGVDEGVEIAEGVAFLGAPVSSIRPRSNGCWSGRLEISVQGSVFDVELGAVAAAAAAGWFLS